MKAKSSPIPSLIPGLFLLLMITACSISIGWGSWGWRSSTGTHSSTQFHTSASLTYTANGETVRANVVDKEVQIVVLRDGKLHGVEGMSAAQRKNLRSLTAGGRTFVDHPKLDAWRKQLTTFNELSQKPDATARELMDGARSLPFDSLIDDALTRWVNNDPERAGAILDLTGEVKLGQNIARKLLVVALRSAAVDDDRVTSWLAEPRIYKDAKSLQTIASCKTLGPKSAEQIMQNIDEVSGSDRKEVYIAAGTRLVSDVAHARMLADVLDELYGSQRTEAALALLRQPGCSVDYAIQLLEHIDDFYGSNRLRVYLTAGQKAIVDARAPRLLASQIDELYGSDRQKAALAILDWEGADNSLALGLLRNIDDFYGNARATVIDHIIDGHYFKDARVQRACLRAIRDELYGSTKRKALTRMLEAEGLDEKVRRLALVELDD